MKKNNSRKAFPQWLPFLFVFFSLILLASKGFPQCPNSDFSLNDFSYWTGSTGINSGGDYTNVVNGLNIGTTNSAPSNVGQQTIINIPGTDPNTGGALSILPPGGTSCCRLGNDNVNYGAERLEYTLPVTSSNCVFTYQYAVVLQDPGHPLLDQPKFTIYVLDHLGNVVDPVCGVYEVSAAAGIPGFNNYLDIQWKDWTTGAVDLSPYIGQNITIQFTTYDCAQGAHFGYAYISCSCGNMQITQQCSGNTDTLTAPAGFASYSWSPGGQNTPSIIVYNPVNGITYSCVCTAVTGCQFVLQTTGFCTPTQLTQICLGDSVIVNAPAGFSSYVWDTGDSTQSIIVVNPVAGDSVSCVCTSLTDTLILNAAVSTIPITGFTANSVTICNGDTAIISASGSYTYLWNTGQTGASINVAPVTTTTYTVTATSSGGCSSSTNAIVYVNPSPAGTISSSPSYCGNPTGTITITPTVGTAPFTYAWNCSPQQTSQTATGLLAGVYTVSLTDSNGCSSAISGNVSLQSTIGLTTTSTPEHCGQSDGTATVTPSGGISPYSYIWNTSPGQTTQTIINIPAGTYTVTVSDANCTATATVTVNNASGPSIAISNVVNAICGNNNGGATAIASGGISPYTYQWNSSPPQYSPSLVNVPAGNYCITVSDANACTATNCVSIGAGVYPAPEICMVTVDTATNHNIIIWEKPVTSGINQYYIYRESNVSGVYNLAGNQNYSVFSTFTDVTSNSLQQPYRYELAINDTCGNTSLLSSYHQSIHLTVSSGSGGSWNLLWNNYEGFTFSTYNIYRRTNSGNMTLLNSVANNVTSYSDLTPPSGTIYYMIEVVRATPCNPSLKTVSYNSSVSNIATTSSAGIAENTNVDYIQIYPNPGNGIFTISVSTQFKNSAIVKILNTLGQVVHTEIMNTQIKDIDLTELPKGIYFLSISGKSFIFYKKIEIE